MKLLAIYGSPRQNGNTDILLDRAVEGFESASRAKAARSEAARLYVRELDFSPCSECGKCAGTGKCPVKDGMRGVSRLIEDSDRMIVSSPVFFYGLPGRLKSLIDRCQCCWSEKYLVSRGRENRAVKPGAFICAGGTGGKNLFEGVKLTIKYFFDATGFFYQKDLLARKVDGYREILKQPEILEQAYNLGAGLAK